MRPQEVNMVCEGLCESIHLLFLSVHIDIILAVYEASFSPTDLTSHLNVALERGCVLSRFSDMRDEVIGYKSPVLEDNSLAEGQVRELGLSVCRATFP